MRRPGYTVKSQGICPDSGKKAFKTPGSCTKPPWKGRGKSRCFSIPHDREDRVASSKVKPPCLTESWKS